MEAGDGPLLIFAGAGSGKTRVLTHRIAHVIATRGVRPHEICAVTFTNKAAREMRTRLEELLGAALSGLWLGTFHALGVRILRRDGDAVGIPSNFTIYDEADRAAALRRALRGEGVDEKRMPYARIGHAISAAKNELLDARAYAAAAEDPFEHAVARAFAAYERELAAAAALDFDDLLTRTVALLRDHEAVRAHYQQRFRHLFVDEYQDTNLAQYRLISMLAAVHRNLTVVGDDDQSVYSFRGADVRNILAFRHDYPDAQLVTLEQNYRSTQSILDVAHSVIRPNPDRAEKRLWTDRGAGEPPRLLSVFDEEEEALTVAAEIDQLIAREGFSLSDIAVLYRTNAQSRAFEEVFLRRGIPYQLIGGVRFYERREIKDVLCYLRLIANPRDSVSFGRVVNLPRRRIGERTIAELETLGRRLSLSPFEAIQHFEAEEGRGAAATALSAFGRLIAGLREMSGRLSVPELLERVVVDTGYRSMLLDGTPEGEERWNNVSELMGLAAEHADVPPPDGLYQFLENVALVSDVDSLSETAGGVTLITLHQVKGLEFPVVFLVGMEEGLLPHLRAMDEGEAGLAEERRLAYVGITRAQRRIFLVHAFRRHIYGAPRLAEASRFLADIPRDQLEVPVRRGAGRPGGDPRDPGAVRRAVHARSVQPNPVELPPQRFHQGMRVEHRVYGAGTILKSTMTRAGEEVMIKFDGAGLRIFAVADAVLTPVGGGE